MPYSTQTYTHTHTCTDTQTHAQTHKHMRRQRLRWVPLLLLVAPPQRQWVPERWPGCPQRWPRIHSAACLKQGSRITHLAYSTHSSILAWSRFHNHTPTLECRVKHSCVEQIPQLHTQPKMQIETFLCGADSTNRNDSVVISRSYEVKTDLQVNFKLSTPIIINFFQCWPVHNA